MHALQKACIVHDMNSVTDYRRLAHHHRGLYFTDDQKEEELQARFAEVAAPNPTRPIRVDVIMGRTLDVAQAGKLAQTPGCTFGTQGHRNDQVKNPGTNRH